MRGEARTYRRKVSPQGLVAFEVAVRETDLAISAARDLSERARESIIKYRTELETFIGEHPVFAETFAPYAVPHRAPAIVKTMADAAAKAGVGPMAAVAGAVAEYVGRDLLPYTDEVIVENGGDIFMRTLRRRRMTVYAGMSPLSERFAIPIDPDSTPLGICTSSGTVGHSTSLGRADAVVVIAREAAFADAMATAIGNRVRGAEDIDAALAAGQETAGLDGVVIIKDDKMGLWGRIEIEPLNASKT